MLRSSVVLMLFLTACSPTEEQLAQKAKDQAFALERMCISRHGTPIKENGELKECKYPWSVHIRKEQ